MTRPIRGSKTETSREPPRPALAFPAPPGVKAPQDLDDGLAAIGVTLAAAQLSKLGEYLARLLATNELMNLTAITDPVEAWKRHMLDALSLVPHVADFGPGAEIADVGSGGGVPGIPLAIARPDLRVTLIEATRKKAQFLEDVSRALDIRNVRVLAERAEKLAETGFARSFDAVTARAVGKVEALLPWTAPLAKAGGRLLFIKGERADEELRSARRALARFGATHERTVVTPTGRVIVLRIR